MAKKVNLNDLVTGTKTPSWARAAREDFLRKEKEREGARANREQEALAIIDSIEADGTVLSDDQKAQILNQFVRTGSLDTTSLPTFAAEPEAPVVPKRADFSGVTATVDTTETGRNPVYGILTEGSRRVTDAVMGDGYFDAGVDAIQGGLQRTARGAIGRLADSDNPLLRGLAEMPGAAYDLATGNLNDYYRRVGGVESGVSRDVASLGKAAKANADATQPVRERLGSRNWLVRNVGLGALDAASSPSSAASLIGGPVGAAAIVDAYDQAYMQAV